MPSKRQPRPTFFATPAAFRAWLEEHHDTAAELLVGFYKKSSGKPSITWPESVDEGLCFGWIDGIRRSLGADAYTIRFAPRKPTSTWSAVNVARVAELTAAGRMAPAGLAAHARRTAARTGIYAYERAALTLAPAHEAKLRANNGRPRTSTRRRRGTAAPSSIGSPAPSARRPATRASRSSSPTAPRALADDATARLGGGHG